MRGRRESVGTLAMIERPTPNVRPIERRRFDLAESEKPQGRTPPTDCGSRIGARAGGKTPKRDRPMAGRLGQRDAADVR